MDKNYGVITFISKCLYFNPLATEGGWGPQSVYFFVFSYLLNVFKQWHLCKFLILGDLSTYLFGLVFLHPTAKKMRIEVHWTHRSAPFLVVLRWDFLKFCFLKSSLKMLLRHFLYVFVFAHPQPPFRQLGPSFLG